MATSNTPTAAASAANSATTTNDSLSEYWRNDFTPLQAAGAMVNAALRADEQDSDLYRRILGPTRTNATSVASSSSSSHLYFPTTNTTTADAVDADAAVPEQVLEHRKSVPLPLVIQEQLSTVRRYSRMGLLAEDTGADLAYLTVDDKLYLWSYQTTATRTTTTSPNSFCSFTVPSGQCVIAVGLVRPKKGTVQLRCLVLACVCVCARARFGTH
jgi:Nup133 N terminal like